MEGFFNSLIVLQFPQSPIINSILAFHNYRAHSQEWRVGGLWRFLLAAIPLTVLARIIQTRTRLNDGKAISKISTSSMMTANGNAPAKISYRLIRSSLSVDLIT